MILKRNCRITLLLPSLPTPRARNNLRLLRMVFRYSDLEAREKASQDKEYQRIKDNYADESGEMGYMTRFDSFYKNNPGFGISFPLQSAEKNLQPRADRQRQRKRY